MLNNSIQDADLMQRIKERDQNALAELEKCYRGLVYNMAFHVLQNQGAAEEITQDIFFRVWRWPHQWDSSKGRFVSWLLTMTRYDAIDRLRQENRQPARSEHTIDTIADLLGKRDEVEDPAYDDGKLIRSLLAQLNAEQRQVIELAYFSGMTHSEIAEQLQTPVGTIKSRLRLGLQKLKEAWGVATQEHSRDV
jgi:RNA polymerase sigma-70 factor, ECF subfamily